MRTGRTRIAAALLALLTAAAALPCAAAQADTAAAADTSAQSGSLSAGSYSAYLARYADAPAVTETIRLTSDRLLPDAAGATAQAGAFGLDGTAVVTEEESRIGYRFSVTEAGLYALAVRYYPVPGKGSTIVRRFLLDGELPYEELREVDLMRRWTNAGEVTQDGNGNDVRPAQVEDPAWMTQQLRDGQGYHTQPLMLYLTAGEHTLTVQGVREPCAIAEITLSPDGSVPTYAEALAAWKAAGAKETSGFTLDIQGEDAKFKSDASIYPTYDRSSPDTVPNSAAYIKLNTIGGSKWAVPGQWLEWEVEVPEEGLYTIAIKGRQNVLNGAYSCRRLLINGSVPFAEAEELRFAYDNGWRMNVLSTADGTACRVLLHAGANTLRLEVTLGEMAELLTEANDSITALNTVYRSILMITGPSPDTQRDYQFRTQIPDTLALLGEQAEAIRGLYERYVALTGQNGQQAQTLRKMYTMAQELYDSPNDIAARFSTFSSDITEMGTWLTTVSQQPLEIDYLTVASPDVALPTIKNSFFRSLWFSLQQLAASFLQDYDISAAGGDAKRSITVWVGNGATGGRDQAQVLQRMIGDSFTPESGVNVNVQLVSMGALLPATMSHKGPDVALTLNSSDPINYAVRHGVLDLSGMDGFDEVKQRFMASALEPFTFDGGTYALPETQTFYMMFCRSDILDELSLEVPQTWQDVVELLPVLQKKNLNFGLPTVIADGAVGVGFPAYAMFLFQHGGSLYNESGSKTLIAEKEGVDAFYQWTKFYTDYGVPTQYDFINRFRSGAVPIGIAEYSTYNNLQVFAPEIRGRWSFCPVPGTVREDGTIDRSSCGTTTGCVIMSSTKDPEGAWAFLKWWTGADVQGDFGVELESVLGAAGRYSPANVEALSRIAWSKTQLTAIKEQWAQVRGLREVPGSYMTSRFADFAFRDVINSGLEPDESLRDAATQIDEEIAVRRREFGLSEE